MRTTTLAAALLVSTQVQAWPWDKKEIKEDIHKIEEEVDKIGHNKYF